MSNRAFGRRAILRAIGAAPMAGHVVAEQLKVSAGMMAGQGIAATVPAVGGSIAGGGPLKLTNFAEWLKIGERQLRQNARHVAGFDPDLVEMRLPLTTKVRMQRERNYQRALEDQKNWFAERLSLNGFVEWWG